MRSVPSRFAAIPRFCSPYAMITISFNKSVDIHTQLIERDILLIQTCVTMRIRLVDCDREEDSFAIVVSFGGTSTSLVVDTQNSQNDVSSIASSSPKRTSEIDPSDMVALPKTGDDESSVWSSIIDPNDLVTLPPRNYGCDEESLSDSRSIDELPPAIVVVEGLELLHENDDGEDNGGETQVTGDPHCKLTNQGMTDMVIL